MNSPFVDKLLTKKLTHAELDAQLAIIPTAMINFDDPSYVEELLDLFENVL